MGNNNKGVGVGVRTAGTKGGGQPWKSNKTGEGGEATTVKEDLTTGGEGMGVGGGEEIDKRKITFLQCNSSPASLKQMSIAFVCVSPLVKPVQWFLPPQE